VVEIEVVAHIATGVAVLGAQEADGCHFGSDTWFRIIAWDDFSRGLVGFPNGEAIEIKVQVDVLFLFPCIRRLYWLVMEIFEGRIVEGLAWDKVFALGFLRLFV
jgi:hypothetical protein